VIYGKGGNEALETIHCWKQQSY